MCCYLVCFLLASEGGSHVVDDSGEPLIPSQYAIKRTLLDTDILICFPTQFTVTRSLPTTQNRQFLHNTSSESSVLGNSVLSQWWDSLKSSNPEYQVTVC